MARLALPDTTYRATVARLRPTHAQRRQLELEERAARWVWNRTIALGRRLRGRGRSLEFVPAAARLTIHRARRAWLRDGSSVVQQQVVKMACDALADWRRGTHRRPRFKSARRGDPVAMRYTARGFSKITSNELSLAKLGVVAHGATRPLFPVSSIDLTRDIRGWLLSFRERVPPGTYPSEPSSGSAIGLDFGVAQTWSLSDGTHHRAPRHNTDQTRRLKALDRAIARRRRPSSQRQSQRYREAQAARARVYARTVAQRRDMLTKLAVALTRAHAHISVEALAIGGMTRRGSGRGRRAKAGLNRALLAGSRTHFVTALQSAARVTGSVIAVVDPRYTSQTCPRCGHVARGNRESQAVFRCQACALTGHADVIAATNIRRRGLAALAVWGDDTPRAEAVAWCAPSMTHRPAENATPVA